MMGAKALWKNRREPVKYRAPSIMIFMQKQKRFPSSFFLSKIIGAWGAKVVQPYMGPICDINNIVITFKLINK